MRAEDINSLESESGIIASLIHNPELSFYSEYLLPNHFTNKENRCVYTAICDLARKGIMTIDPYNIIEDLNSSEATRKYADELSVDKLQELVEVSDVLARSTVEEYKMLVSNVMDAAFRRDTFQRLKECQALCYDRSEENVEQKIYATIDDVMTEFSTANEIPPYKEVIDDCWEEIKSRQGNGFAGIPFKFGTLNEYATIEPGELFVFAAEAKQGKSMMLDGFMLSMSELICWCKEQGMAIGTARGSVGGSRVAYVADIIDLNPETWHTVFSRFCNEDRVEIGDIDIDCIESDRPAIFKHITSRFGEDKTARVASFGTMQSKGLIDDVGRALSFRWESEHGTSNDNPWSLNNVAKIKSEFESDEEKTKKKYPELFYYYDGLIDTKISQSVHPAGMVISPITLVDNFGVFDKDGDNCLLLDMENIHDFTGLAKYDFLILKTVSLMRRKVSLPKVSRPSNI